MINGNHIPKNRHFIFLQPESAGCRFCFRDETVLLYKTLHNFSWRDVITVGEKTHDFIVIHLFRNICLSVYHPCYFLPCKGMNAYKAGLNDKWGVRIVFTDFRAYNRYFH